MSGTLDERLCAILRGTPGLMRVLEVARELDLPDWWVVSGAVYQPVLNRLTGRAADYGIKDYDLVYYDAADLSYEAEDVVIRRAAGALDADLSPLVEVRNQARVHLWFEGKFGEPYTPLASAKEALERFVSPMFAIAVRLGADDALEICAPFGLEDLFALRLRPNPRRKTLGFAAAAAKVAARWPEVRVET